MLTVEKQGLQHILATLRMTWDSLDTLARLRDIRLVQRAGRCVHDADWQRQPVFVAWFAEWLTRPLRWGGSCICHVTECEAGEAVECIEKGRLLPLARAYSERRFQAGLETAKEWGVSDFDECSQDSWRALWVRSVLSLASAARN